MARKSGLSAAGGSLLLNNVKIVNYSFFLNAWLCVFVAVLYLYLKYKKNQYTCINSILPVSEKYPAVKIK